MPRSNCRPARSRQTGFSLLELIVVLVILGLLAGVVGSKVIGWLDRGTHETARIQLEQLRQALSMFRLECGRYPTTGEGLQALVENPGSMRGWDGPYLEDSYVPKDPWDNEYQYRCPGENGDYDLWTYGADGASGGDGVNADITSWKPPDRSAAR